MSRRTVSLFLFIMKCPRCHKTVKKGSEYCESCGAPLTDVHYCERCGTIRQRGITKCPVCGTPYPKNAANGFSSNDAYGMKKGPASLWKPGIIILLLFVLVGTFAFMKRANNQKYARALDREYAAWTQAQAEAAQTKSKQKKSTKKSSKSSKSSKSGKSQQGKSKK